MQKMKVLKEKVELLIDDMVKEAGSEEEAKAIIMDYVVLLCEDYDKRFGEGEESACEKLDELDQAVGDRRKYNDAYRQYKKNLRNKEIEEKKEEVRKDYNECDMEEKTPEKFYQKIVKEYNEKIKKEAEEKKKKKEEEKKKKEEESIAENYKGYNDYGIWKKEEKKEDEEEEEEKCNEEYNDYQLSKNTILATLKEPKIEIEVNYADDFPFIREYSVETLKKFAYYLSLAFKKQKLTQVLDRYIGDVKKHKKQHSTKMGGSAHRLLSDGLPKDMVKGLIEGENFDDEAAWRLIWGKSMKGESLDDKVKWEFTWEDGCERRDF